MRISTFTILLGALLITLKLAGALILPWWAVLLPILVFLAYWALPEIIGALVTGIVLMWRGRQ